jgi:hypothetical protein
MTVMTEKKRSIAVVGQDDRAISIALRYALKKWKRKWPLIILDYYGNGAHCLNEFTKMNFDRGPVPGSMSRKRKLPSGCSALTNHEIFGAACSFCFKRLQR